MKRTSPIRRWHYAVLLAWLAAVLAAPAADTAFWEPYEADEWTWALAHFDEPTPLQAAGKTSGEGRLGGGAKLAPEGRFGGALRVDGTGYAAFPTPAWEPGAMAIHFANRSLAIEAWVRLERLPEGGRTGAVVWRPEGRGRLGLALLVNDQGALGLRLKPVGGSLAEHWSPPAAVPVGEWVHVAGVSCGGHLSIGRDVLYVNGVEVFNTACTEAAGGEPEAGPGELFVGGTPDGNGIVGAVDAVRLHARVARLWPLDPMPWLARLAADGPAPLDSVLVRERQPLLTFPLDADTRPVASDELHARDPAIVERFTIAAKGEHVPGVRGQAWRGPLTVSGFPLAPLSEGSLEFWARPRGVNNVSDRNLTMVYTSAFAAYFFNNVGPTKDLSFYYHDAEGRMHMHGDTRGTEIHPGRWYHVLFTWNPERVSMYVDGALAASGTNAMTTPANKGQLASVAFNQHRLAFDIDEMHVYGVCLAATEVANRHVSFVDPTKITPPRPPAPLHLEAWRLPSDNLLVYRLTGGAGVPPGTVPRLRLTDAAGAEVLAGDCEFTEELVGLTIPPLADGAYTLEATVTVDGRELRGEPIRIVAQRLPWEGNTLGVTDEVFAPFTPVAVAGDQVSVVLRDYRMNAFGLWDSVVSQGRELLAGPVRLRYETEAGGEGRWAVEAPRCAAAAPHRAEFHGRAAAPEVIVETVSEIEMDGMMKVHLTLRPGAAPATVRRLWLEAPLRAAEATLMHEDTGSMRRNYSGLIPEGDGPVWQSRRRPGWRNAFAGYLWLGGEERGLAWFAENDSGWITAKGLSDRPLVEVVREADRVVLRVYLVDEPATIRDERRIVFGMQASPAKPLPADWRTGARGGGLPVNPWGGHQCADKFPFEDRWEIVDRIIEQQLAGTDNGEWFRAFQREHDVPPLRGTTDWLQSVGHFAGHLHYRNRPTLVYFEEMTAPTYRDDWHVYKDEWARDLLDPRREWPRGYDVFRQGRQVDGTAYRITFGPSYRDYGAWYTNEWLKRGVGIYWDNTYLTTSTNPLTSAAYPTEDGEMQPALSLWNQREYSRRTWNLMRQWERERGEKLLFLQHMTNANLLPILAWTTTAFDNEFSAESYARGVGYPRQHDPKEPFPPDYLRAQSMGRQTGCYPALCHAQFQFGHMDIAPEGIPPAEMDRPRDPGSSIYTQRRNWGMSRVHEIPAGGFAADRLERALRDFGYGTDAVRVHNYWDQPPALVADRDDVKWLLLARPADRRLLLVLQSWSRNPGPATVRLDPAAIGFAPAATAINAETGAPVTWRDDGFGLAMESAYDLKVLTIGAPALPEGARFADDFRDGASPRWSYVSPFFAYAEMPGGGRALRMAKNTAPWMGPGRLAFWQGTETWGDGTLEVRFRVTGLGGGRTPLFTVATRAARPAWSQHGLSHTRLANGQFIELHAHAEAGTWGLVRWTIGADGKRGRTAETKFGAPDDQPHTLALTMAGPATTVTLDGAPVAEFTDTPDLGGAFGIDATGSIGDTLYVDLERVTLLAPAR